MNRPSMLFASAALAVVSCKSAATPAEHPPKKDAVSGNTTPTAAPTNKSAMTTPTSPVVEGQLSGTLFATSHGAATPGVAIWSLPVQAGQGPRSFIPMPKLYGGPRAIGLSPDSDRIAVAASEGGEVRVLDVNRPHAGATVAGPAARVEAVGFSPDGIWLAAIGQAPAPPPPGANDNSAKAVSYVSGGLLYLWKLGQLAAPAIILKGPAAAAQALAFSPDKTRVTVLYKDGTCVSWSLSTHKQQTRVELTGRGHALAYGPTGAVAVTRTVDGIDGFTVDLLDSQSLNSTVTTKSSSSWPDHIAWSADGVIAVSTNDAVVIFDAKQAKETARLDYSASASGPNPRAAGFVGNQLLVLGGEKQAWVSWNLATGVATATSSP